MLHASNSFFFSGTLQCSPKISRGSSSHWTLKVEEEGSTTEMSFLVDCSMLCHFWGVSKHHLICPCRTINFRVLQQMNYCPLLPCSLVPVFLCTAWNILTALCGVIGHLEVRKICTECLRADLWALLLCWNYRLYSKTSHILLKTDCYHFSLVAFLTLVLSTGITLRCDHTLVALGYVYLLWLKGRSSQKSISDALPVSTLSEHCAEILSKTKL